MPNRELANLRRARSRCHFRFKQAEALVAGYETKLATLEAQMMELDPQLWLPPRRYKPNPHFARNELPRIAMAVLREAAEPLATKVVALRALATKGVMTPDRRTMKVTRTRLLQFLSKLDKRGITQKVGSGNRTKRILAER